VRKQLRLRSSFFGPFLCATALPRPEAAVAAAPGGARCLLPRLDIGEEKPIQQLIAAFTGVPIGSSWRFVQLAAAHLAPFLAPGSLGEWDLCFPDLPGGIPGGVPQ